MTSIIAIHYRLYEATEPGKDRKYKVVSEPEDVALELEICNSDTNKAVTSVGTVAAQNAVLHEHVLSVGFDLPIRGYLIRLDQPKESIWDDRNGGWVKVDAGGAIYYPVDSETDADRLFLAVWTQGATPVRSPTTVVTG